jgi:hypothetical protein
MMTADLDGDNDFDSDDTNAFSYPQSLDSLAARFGGNLMTTTVTDSSGRERTSAFGQYRVFMRSHAIPSLPRLRGFSANHGCIQNPTCRATFFLRRSC